MVGAPVPIIPTSGRWRLEDSSPRAITNQGHTAGLRPARDRGYRPNRRLHYLVYNNNNIETRGWPLAPAEKTKPGLVATASPGPQGRSHLT